MINMHNITIFVDGIHRDFKVDDDQIISNDWNRVIEDMLPV